MGNRALSIALPEVTLANEYLDQVTLKKNFETIEKALVHPPDTRDKALVVTVMGSGGGKTRLLETSKLQSL